MSPNLQFVLPKKEKTTPLLPWAKDFLDGLSQIERRGTIFKVYWRDKATRIITFLGETVERRLTERRNNLIDLLTKARKDFSNKVSDPIQIFLMGP